MLFETILPNNQTVAYSVVTPSSFVYGNSIDASRFVQLEDMECNFQPLNITFQVPLIQISTSGLNILTLYSIPLVFSHFLFTASRQ